jgi:hypothetical protein
MRHIERDGYHLLDWRDDRRDLVLPKLWQHAPELVVGRFLVNTSFDSGFLTLNPEQIAAGWHVVGRLGHSPKIASVAQVPHDQYDEWLAFDSTVEISEFETLVNYATFTPIDFSWEEKREHYWHQILRWRPLHVFGENDGIYVVTADEHTASKLECA